MRVLFAALAALLLTAAPAAARPGDLDRTFADGGRVAYKFGSGGYVAGLVLQDGRRPFLSVDALLGYGPAPTALTLTAGGRLAGRTAFPPPAVGAPAFSGDYALSRIGDAPARYALFRIGASTGITLTLPDLLDGRRLALEARSWGVDRAGRAILIVSYSTGSGARDRTRALRFLADGRLDRSYGRDGLAAVGEVSAINALVRPDGRLFVLTGEYRRDTRVIALDARGHRVAGFRTRTLMQGRFPRYEGPRALIAAPGGRLLVAGGGLYRSGWVARLRSDGRADRRFGDHGLTAIADFNANAMIRDRRGRIVLAGIAEARVSPYQGAVARLTRRGRLDRSFGRRGVVVRQLGAARGVTLVASEVRHVAIDDRGRIVVAGEAYDDEYELRDDLGRSYPAIARLHG